MSSQNRVDYGSIVAVLSTNRNIISISFNTNEGKAMKMEKKYTFFVDPTETPQAELGSGFIQSYLGGGTISKGFVVATQRRAYFKGKSYFKDFKGHWKKQMQERTVDLKDITGTGYTSMRQLWAMVAAIVSLVWLWPMFIFLRRLPSGADGWINFF